VTLTDAPAALVDLAREFLARRTTHWHVAELSATLVDAVPPDPRVPAQAPPLPYGAVPGGFHAAAPDGVVEPALGALDVDLVVTPWRGVLVPEAAA
jgi:precorrin-3B synthase